MKKEFISLGKWLEENDRNDILERWDEELNGISIYDVYLYDKKRYFIKCDRNLHESELFHINLFHRKKVLCECRKCKSLAQGMIDMYGEEYFNKVWSDKNQVDPWTVGFQSKTKFWWNCVDNPEHIYKQAADSKSQGQGCSLCNCTSIIRESLLDVYPSIIKIWSDKNTKQPSEYSKCSGQKAWFKCPSGKHDDKYRKISVAAMRNFRCPDCVMEKMYNHTYVPDSNVKLNYKSTSTKKLRQTGEAFKWRINALLKDNHTCQCCGKQYYRLNVHHIYNVADFPNLCNDKNNSITLCENCHGNRIQGSFHNIYGMRNNTPEQLEEYINNKRKQLGINIPFSIENYLNGVVLKPEQIKEVI